MNWLVCNNEKCHKRMKNSSRSWSLTQCGHIYCNHCVDQMGNKCPQCDTVDFSLIPLTNPPKLEMVLNYFTNLDDIIEQSSKVINFQENQQMIAVLAAQQMERKYVMIKEMTLKAKKQLEEVTAQCQKLQLECDNVQRVIQSHSARRVPESKNTNSMNFDGYCKDRTPFESISLNHPPSTNTSSSSASTVRHRDSVHASQKSAHKTPQKKNPKYRYNPNSLFSTPGYTSGETTDSGHSTMAPNTGERVEGFLVPSISRVPKSAATAKRKTPTGVRLSAPKSHWY